MSELRIYIVKFQVVDTEAPSFDFVGWPFQWAVVQVETEGDIEHELWATVVSEISGRCPTIRINTVTEVDSPVTVLPIKIEQNTVVEKKDTDRVSKEEKEKKRAFEKEYYGPLWTSLT
jgi:hypothetical protein